MPPLTPTDLGALSDEELAQLYKTITGGGTTAAPATQTAGALSPDDLGGLDLTSLAGLGAASPRDSQDQVDVENLMGLAQLLQSQQEKPVQQERVLPPQTSLGQDFGGSSPEELSSMYGRMGLALNYDDIMRQRNQRDLDRNPAPAAVQPTQNPLIAQLTQALAQRLLNPAAAAAPAAPEVHGVTGPTVQQTVQNTDAQLAAERTRQMLQNILGGRQRQPQEIAAQTAAQNQNDQNAGSPMNFLTKMLNPSLPRLPF